MIPPKYLLTRHSVRANVPIVGNVCNEGRAAEAWTNAGM